MNSSPSDKKMLRVELAISDVLSWGIVASLSLIIGGILLCFKPSGGYGAGGGTSQVLAQGHDIPRTASGFARSLAHWDGTAVIYAGLFLLIATPVIRVAVSVWAFIAVRDRTYVVITSVVLALLLGSFFLGKAG